MTPLASHIRQSALLPVAGNFLLGVSACGFSPGASAVQTALLHAASAKATRAWSDRMDKRTRFRSLASKWKDETAFESTTVALVLHPSYQEIIGMGPDALPLILDELNREPAQWFWALRAISAEDPVVPRNRGDVLKMRDAWLQWGAEKELWNGDRV